MRIKVRKKEKQYAQVHKNLLLNKTLSIQSKGIGAIIECYSDDWELSHKSLEIQTNLNEKTLRKYIKELEKGLFLFRIQKIKNCETTWFFDSETLDFEFVKNEVVDIQKVEKIRFLTAYQFLAHDILACQGIRTYNNTNNSVIEFTSFDALNILLNKQKLDLDEINSMLIQKQFNKDKQINRLQNLCDANAFNEEIEF
jgi:hypothetical protein